MLCTIYGYLPLAMVYINTIIKAWTHIAARQGLQDINVHTIAANATGQVALVHDKGIDVWYPNSRQFRSYNSRQGMNIDSTSVYTEVVCS